MTLKERSEQAERGLRIGELPNSFHARVADLIAEQRAWIERAQIILQAILDTDDRGQGLPWQEAMAAADNLLAKDK